MNIDIKDIITLNDSNEYIVVSKINYQSNTYYYLVDKNDDKNIKFCLEKKDSNNTLIEVLDEALNQKLLPLFFKNVKEHISEFNSESLK